MKWQNIKRLLIGSSIGIVTLFSALFLLTGVDYVYTGDINCGETCESYINVTTSYWRICFDNYEGTKYEEETLFKKQTRSRTLHVNLDKIDNVIKTEPEVQVDWLVPARGAGNWRPLKNGDCWERRKINKIKLVGHKEKYQTVKWSFDLGDKVNIDPIWEGIVDIKNRTYINELRNRDIIQKFDSKTNKYISYDHAKKRFLLEDQDKKLIIKIRLISNYSVGGLIASKETIVAKFLIEDWKNGKVSLIDRVKFYDVNNDYIEINKTFIYKYGIEVEGCSLGECLNYTEWIDFENLDELPHKNITISAWTKTEINEMVEWMPTIEGIEIPQWAEWLIGTAEYQGEEFNHGFDHPKQVIVTKDGTKMYLTDAFAVMEYNLSTIYNVSTATLSSTYDPTEAGVFMTFFINLDDGSKLYAFNNGDDKIYQYTVETPWFLADVTYDEESLFVSGDGRGLFIKSDGSKLYIADFSRVIKEYNCTNANVNISGCQYSTSFDASNQIADMRNVWFKDDGTKMYAMDRTAEIDEYNLTIPWLINTSIFSTPYDPSGQDADMEGLSFNDIGTYFYVTGNVGDDIFQYSMVPLPPSDTCTCAGLNTDWEIDLSDFCVISDACDLGTGYLNFTGTGNVTCDAKINTTNMGDPGSNGIFYIFDDCYMEIS